MSNWQKTMMVAILIVGFALSGCTRTVTKEVIVEVKVPVPVECMGERPTGITALRDVLTREEFSRLTTDQRENLLAAQAIDRKTYGERMDDAAAGCR